LRGQTITAVEVEPVPCTLTRLDIFDKVNLRSADTSGSTQHALHRAPLSHRPGYQHKQQTQVHACLFTSAESSRTSTGHASSAHGRGSTHPRICFPCSGMSLCVCCLQVAEPGKGADPPIVRAGGGGDLVKRVDDVREGFQVSSAAMWWHAAHSSRQLCATPCPLMTTLAGALVAAQAAIRPRAWARTRHS
jgi:hypothetical protein